MKGRDAPASSVPSLRGVAVAVAIALVVASGVPSCGTQEQSMRVATTPSVLPAVPPAVMVPRLPIVLDTADAALKEFWPIAVTPERQLEETRRIVEHLQADLSIVDGFRSATLLASGDGTSLVLVAAWRDDGAADRAHAALAGWLHAETDTAMARRRFGTATQRVFLHRTVGTPPILDDAAMLLFTRYALKPGHSFGAMAALSDSSLVMRVLQDTSVQGGAMLVAADSGAIYVLLRARTATALDSSLPVIGGALPFWAPFARRDEQLLAAVAVVQHR